jgi:hypothetical protein
MKTTIQNNCFGKSSMPASYADAVKDTVHTPIMCAAIGSKKKPTKESRTCKRPVLGFVELVADINNLKHQHQFMCKRFLASKRKVPTVHKEYRPRAKGKNQSLIEK